MTDKNPRRGMDRTVRVILTSLTLMLVGQGAGALLYAGRLDERVKYIERHIKKTNEQESRIIRNELKLEQNSKDDQKILKLLNDIDTRQRKIELKIERLSK